MKTGSIGNFGVDPLGLDNLEDLIQFKNRQACLRDLPLFGEQIDCQQVGSEVFLRFKQHPSLPGIVLTQGTAFMGMISRQRFYEHITSFRYSVDVFWDRPVSLVSSLFERELLIFPGSTPIVQAAPLVLQRGSSRITEPVVVQLDPQTHRVLDVQQLLMAQSQIHQLTADALAISEVKNQTILQGIPDLLLRIDPEGWVLDVKGDSTALGFLCSGRESHISTLLPEALHASLTRILSQPLEIGQIHIDEVNLPPTLSDRCFELRLVITGEDERLLILRDITARKRIEELRQTLERNRYLEFQMEEMKKLNQLKDDFLSTVSHELRTPLSNMRVALTLLKNYPMPKPYQTYLEILEVESNRELDLVNNLLDLQRMEAGDTIARCQTFDLSGWLSHSLDPWKIKAISNHLTFEISMPDNLIIDSDPILLERIIIELASNACKYTPSGGSIALHIQECEEMILLHISNSCSLIKPDDLSKMFENFYRIPIQDPWRQGGTGLGLALVKQSVKQLQGSIKADWQDNFLHVWIRFPAKMSSQN